MLPYVPHTLLSLASPLVRAIFGLPLQLWRMVSRRASKGRSVPE